MGAYSEMDIDLRYGDSPFEESDAPAQNIPAFVEEPPMAPPATPPLVATTETPAERDTTPPPATPAQEADTVPADTSLNLTPGRRQRKLPNRSSLTAWPL